MGGERHVVGLIGAGIAASLSPALHEREAAELGLDYTYELLDIDERGVAPEAVGELNPIVFAGGRAAGHNTDWPGFEQSFARGLPGAATDRVLLLGAGGA